MAPTNNISMLLLASEKYAWQIAGSRLHLPATSLPPSSDQMCSLLVFSLCCSYTFICRSGVHRKRSKEKRGYSGAPVAGEMAPNNNIAMLLLASEKYAWQIAGSGLHLPATSLPPSSYQMCSLLVFSLCCSYNFICRSGRWQPLHAAGCLLYTACMQLVPYLLRHKSPQLSLPTAAAAAAAIALFCLGLAFFVHIFLYL